MSTKAKSKSKARKKRGYVRVDWTKHDKELAKIARDPKRTFLQYATEHGLSYDALRKHTRRELRLTKAAVILLACLLCLPATTRAQGVDLPDPVVEPVVDPLWSVSALTDAFQTDKVEVRLTRDLQNMWKVGVLGTYFAEDVDDSSRDWGVGLFATLDVTPDASVPLSNWFPAIGGWVLPETLEARGYLIGKGQAVPFDDGVDLVLGVGPGLRIGPVCVEWVYDFVESGDADSPALSSKATLWVGIEPIRF